MTHSEPSAQAGAMAGTSIGHYKIVREIAEDSVGQAFEAIDLTRKKRVAIKQLRPEAASRAETVPRLYSEAKTLARLNHPYIARLFGFVRQGDRLYLVMEFVEGETLEAMLRKTGRLQPNIALAFFQQILSAIGFAHRLGVIHGDLKPSNIMVTNCAVVKVLDFPIAPILGNPGRTGPRVSSFRYMSPEQIRGEPVDARSDIYSLGVLLYELIVGNVPFDADSEDGIVRAQIAATPLPPSALVPNSPKWLDAFLLRALAQSPSNRFQSITAMSRAMGAAVEANTASASPKRGSVRHTHWARRVSFAFNALLSPGNQALESLKAVCARASETAWKRHAVLAFLLVSFVLEIFFFGHANMLLRSSHDSTAGSPLSDAVDAMLARAKMATSAGPPGSGKEGRGETVKPMDPSPIELRSAATSKTQPEPGQRRMINRPRRPSVVASTSDQRNPSPKAEERPSRIATSNDQTILPERTMIARSRTPSVVASNVASNSDKQSPLPNNAVVEPILSGAKAENSTAKTQLNVKWEN
jgi:serine/threonine protein kinase